MHREEWQRLAELVRAAKAIERKWWARMLLGRLGDDLYWAAENARRVLSAIPEPPAPEDVALFTREYICEVLAGGVGQEASDAIKAIEGMDVVRAARNEYRYDATPFGSLPTPTPPPPGGE